MNGNYRREENPRTNVVSLTMDESFFFERAVRALDRYQYDKALKYFRKAVELKPDNPVNHCNMAGILSEMGDYEASNAVLLHVLEQVDPAMTECRFYMANNFANMERFEEAEEALLAYLGEDAAGQFLHEAEEMIELLQIELKRKIRDHSVLARRGSDRHERARTMLEEGMFAEAAGLLEELLEEYPEFAAAANNLALAYYYMGMTDRALEKVEDVLLREPGNLHGLCNLAIFRRHSGPLGAEEASRLAGRLAAIVPFHREHAFKLATTLGILGEHEAAYRHFRRLLAGEDASGDASIHHYCAVAALLSGRPDEAEKMWNQTLKLDPEAEAAAYYLKRLPEWRVCGITEPVNYHYRLEAVRRSELWRRWEERLPEDSPAIRAALIRTLRSGSEEDKRRALQACRPLADEEMNEALRELAGDDTETAELRDLARAALGESDPEQADSAEEDELPAPKFSREPAELPVWEKRWQDVLDAAIRASCAPGDFGLRRDLEALWTDFLRRLYPDVPVLSYVEGWAAALDYLADKLHRGEATYEEIGRRHGVSASTVGRYAKRIDQVCGIKERMTMPGRDHRKGL
ncbi:tetratricopeptide repeat protein [Saccharibacillus alkalitolerans]|uniref:Tetratricopeptide repeat protein n=1 Tax=Saccharibacillus alkalitolerans TaxID=2705290 RepID=A0ABX0F845_9BACL|nr:tetratricopeptide repeat protein [Saccharibacillus alkalitolerans]NGZ77136.1 tetratricopeptide repeat protein [Saccharibacillus alkalitolerans]